MADPQIRSCQLPELLARNGLKQVDLAVHLDVTEAHISQVCNLKRLLSLQKLRKTSTFLKCKMDDIYVWDD